MAVFESGASGSAAKRRSVADPARPPRSLVRLAFVRVAIAAVVAVISIFAAGFLWFVWSVPSVEVVLNRNADGIVVLTGGASRISDAIELLAAGRGKRLLISGVHHGTTSTEIARLVPEYQHLVACCVDLDRSAVNTVGNAVETKRWVKARGFRSLIVVTSSYHMPRTMAELARRIPDVDLIPFPVVTDKMRAERWWTSPPTARLLFSEYLKYIVAVVRLQLEPTTTSTDLAVRRGHLEG
jgi:uncharacterized SAM-binding protein YcdF (DUF218 family)